ncbi:TLD domain-containing protein 2-like [Cucurbita pepo subsp. pepo]|uniref:TLD domain-containing protein 2-like n=1 Tax=Cucurbita pepo subsp. pepo TaxID=3664 RepID=UPI000C9D5F1C|nr:TLD domain-containing protein 2-like [Cucurbita pepo subsp. pepo]
MFAFKEKVTESLSRLLADSPDSASHSLTSLDDDPSPVRSFSKGGKALSSYFSYIIPFAGFEGPKSGQPQNHYRPQQPRPVPYDPVNFDPLEPLDDEYSTACGTKGTSIFEVENKECSRDNEEDFDDSFSGRSTNSSEVFEDVARRPSPEKSVQNSSVDSVLMSIDTYGFLVQCLPNIVKGRQWILLYSTLRHGISLRTLIRKSSELSGPCLLVVGDRQGAVFGGLLDSPLKPTAKRKYQGTNQTFVFTTMYGEPQLFRPTGANRYFYMCMDDLLALGGGSNFALRLEEDLLNGTSGPCETFGNSCLAHSQEFELKNVELWGFAHASQYLS